MFWSSNRYISLFLLLFLSLEIDILPQPRRSNELGYCVHIDPVYDLSIVRTIHHALIAKTLSIDQTMNPLPTHILDVYEDRKPLDHPALQTPIHNPPQYYQSADPSNLGQAGPSRIMANPGHNAGGMSGAEGEEGSWLSNHGMPWWMAAPRELPSRLTPWSMEKIAQLQVRLAKRLGPEYVATRPGPGGGPKLT